MPTPPAGGDVHGVWLWCASVCNSPPRPPRPPNPPCSASPTPAFPGREILGAVRETEVPGQRGYRVRFSPSRGGGFEEAGAGLGDATGDRGIQPSGDAGTLACALKSDDYFPHPADGVFPAGQRAVANPGFRPRLRRCRAADGFSRPRAGGERRLGLHSHRPLSAATFTRVGSCQRPACSPR